MYLVETINKFGISQLVVFSRENGVKKKELITSFRPYFFVEEDCILEDDAVVRVEKGFVTIDDFKVKKVSVKSTKDMVRLRENRKTWMSDFKFANRYVVDTYKDIPEEDLKVGYFDIETDSENVMPDIVKADQAITCMSIEILGTPTTFVWREDLKKEIIGDIRYFDNEVEMLKDFIKFMKEEDIDILSGYYIKGFDLPYLINRCTRLDINYSDLSPLKNIYIRENDIDIKGLVILDILELLKHPFIKDSEMPSYSLDDVAKEVLGEQKIKHTLSYRQMWLKDLPQLIKYNIKDTELVRKIDEKKHIIEFVDIVRRITKCQFDNFKPYHAKDVDKVFYGTSNILDCYMMSTFPGIILPNKRKEPGVPFEGAFIIEPIPGLYEYLICLDLEGLYTSIIKTFNISYETLDPNGEIDVGEGIKFKREKGFIPKLLEKQKVERDYFKKLMKESKTDDERAMNDQRQKAIKILGNAFFGILGNRTSRLYKTELASSVTRIGRDIINHTINTVKGMGYNVVYADTDSNFIEAKSKTKIGVLKEGTMIRNVINKSYDEFVKRFNVEKHYLNIQFEKAIERMIMLYKKGGDTGAKKRYAYKLLWSEKYFDPNKLHMVGVDAIRSDQNFISKNLQTTVLEMVLDGKPELEVKDYLRSIEKRIRNKEYILEQIGFPVQITKELKEYDSKGPVVVGALYSNEILKTNFGKGNKPKWLPIKAVIGYPDTKYLTFETEVPIGFKIDYDEVVRKTIKSKVESIFKTVNWDWEDLCVGNSSIKRWL